MSNAEDRFIIDCMTWSFSRLNFSCLSEWRRHYIWCQPQEQNFYAEFGSLIHQCIQYYCKGILPADQILEYFDNNFEDKCQSEFDPERREQYYLQGYDYLSDLPKNLPIEDYEIVGVEKKLSFFLKERRPGYEEKDYPFTGFIDLLLRNKKTGNLIFMDHKSSGMKFKRDGLPYKNEEEHWQNFQRQQLLYTVPFIEAGEKVDFLCWNMFRNQFIKTIHWSQEGYDEAYNWALDQIHLLENESEWEPNVNFFYCKNLCGYRFNCPYNEQEDMINEFQEG